MGKSVTRNQLRQGLQDTGEFTYREARLIVDVIIDCLTRQLKEEGILELSLGTLTIRHPATGRAYRLGKIVQTGRKLKVHFKRKD